MLTLIVVAVIAHFFWWIAAAVGAVLLFVAAVAMWLYVEKCRKERRARNADLAARAYQHLAWVMQAPVGSCLPCAAKQLAASPR